LWQSDFELPSFVQDATEKKADNKAGEICVGTFNAGPFVRISYLLSGSAGPSLLENEAKALAENVLPEDIAILVLPEKHKAGLIKQQLEQRSGRAFSLSSSKVRAHGRVDLQMMLGGGHRLSRRLHVAISSYDQ